MLLLAAAVVSLATATRVSAEDASDLAPFVRQHCLSCHGGDQPDAGLNLEMAISRPLSERTGEWEKVAKRLRARQMPPVGAPRPADGLVAAVLDGLEKQLDAHARLHPRPGRTSSLRRLTRREYQHAIRDLLDLEVDVSAWIPPDESSGGFDNITVGTFSPTLVNRYVLAAQKIARLAIGSPTPSNSPDGATFRVPADVTQEEQVPGLPWGTRGGLLVRHHFPRNGEYDFEIRLARDRNEQVEGLTEPHELELLLDDESLQTWTVRPPQPNAASREGYAATTHEDVDRHLRVRLPVTAGPHAVGVTFVKNGSSLLETSRQPLHVHFNMYRHPRLGPAIYQVTVTGPFGVTSPGDTPSRRRIFSSSTPPSAGEEEVAARRILSTLLRRAIRQPVSEEDLSATLALFREGRETGDFESGIERGLSGILIHPRFLFRFEQDSASSQPGQPHRISDLELASRLSFFLWSSLPDEQLLALAEQGQLSQPDTLSAQVRRMLADSRSHALVTDFAGQWLHLANLAAATPDARLFPDFDDNLRQSFREETERFVERLLREDRSLLDLIHSQHTFLNERLARHYGIPHVSGSHFRPIVLAADSRRGGLLRQGSILTVTSYATRTSPVIRGKWILENLVGTPPPPPPPNVPALRENTVAANLSVRERLAQHRANPACAGCHDFMDPVGFSLENFDAVGRWREMEDDRAIDSAGALPDASQFQGVEGLEQALAARPEVLTATVAEKLLTFALGRPVEPDDGPAIRAIVREARLHDYRFSAVVLGVVHSVPFQMRESP